METSNLPAAPYTMLSEEAIVPSEEASQPVMNDSAQNTMITADVPKKAKKHKITFEDETEINEKPISQTSSNYRQVLSQPAPTLSHKERLLWLQKRRSMGLWAQCDDCKRWRFLEDVLDSHELPDKWYCRLNPDRNMASCLIAEAKLKLSDEEELIHNEYSAGSLVWARMQGWPWWPAMVDDCPDTEQFYWLDGFSDIPTYYNVVFFDNEATRAWISPENLQPYNDYSGTRKFNTNAKKHKQRLQTAKKLADQALNLPLSERLAKFSFLARYSGHIKTPQKLSNAVIEKYQKKLQRKYNMAFPSERQESIERAPINHANNVEKEIIQKNNVIVLGTPKKHKDVPRRRILSSEKGSEMILDSLVPVELDENDNDNDHTWKPDGHLVEPNSMSVQLTDSNVKTSTVDTAAAQSTYCELGEEDSSKNTTETNAVAKATVESNATTCNDNDSIQNSTQSELATLVRIPTPSSDDFDF